MRGPARHGTPAVVFRSILALFFPSVQTAHGPAAPAAAATDRPAGEVKADDIPPDTLGTARDALPVASDCHRRVDSGAARTTRCAANSAMAVEAIATAASGFPVRNVPAGKIYGILNGTK